MRQIGFSQRGEPNKDRMTVKDYELVKLANLLNRPYLPTKCRKLHWILTPWVQEFIQWLREVGLEDVGGEGLISPNNLLYFNSLQNASSNVPPNVPPIEQRRAWFKWGS